MVASYQDVLNEVEARLEFERRWIAAGRPLDLSQLFIDVGYVLDGQEQVQPDYVIDEMTH